MTYPTQKEVEEKVFSEEQFAELQPKMVPHHVAIIMDGNRRWAKKRNQPAEIGHWQGAEKLDEIVRAAADFGIKVLTVFAFSTENWKRSPQEVNALMHLLETFLIRKKGLLVKEGVRLEVIGDLTKLSPRLIEVLNETKSATREGNQIDLVLAINYGGRDDICRAIQRIVDETSQGKIQKEEITEDLISQYLDTARWPDPDLLIRPSGNARISNFLNWQISYSEIFYTDVLWPDFSKEDLQKAIIAFQKRHRRFGL